MSSTTVYDGDCYCRTRDVTPTCSCSFYRMGTALALDVPFTSHTGGHPSVPQSCRSASTTVGAVCSDPLDVSSATKNQFYNHPYLISSSPELVGCTPFILEDTWPWNLDAIPTGEATMLPRSRTPVARSIGQAIILNAGYWLLIIKIFMKIPSSTV